MLTEAQKKRSARRRKVWKKAYNKVYYLKRKRAAGKVYHKRKCAYCGIWYRPRFKTSKTCGRKKCQVLNRRIIDKKYNQRPDVKTKRKLYEQIPEVKQYRRVYMQNRRLDKKERTA